MNNEEEPIFNGDDASRLRAIVEGFADEMGIDPETNPTYWGPFDRLASKAARLSQAEAERDALKEALERIGRIPKSAMLWGEVYEAVQHIARAALAADEGERA